LLCIEYGVSKSIWHALPSHASIARGVPERDKTVRFQRNMPTSLSLLEKSGAETISPFIPFCKFGYKREGGATVIEDHREMIFVTKLLRLIKRPPNPAMLSQEIARHILL
jgi:hypothetical protein